MAEIRLKYTDKVVKVDGDLYELLSQHEWLWHSKKYAVRWEKIDNKWNPILMHRYIMNAPKGVEIDHIDKDGLNNTKENLRFCNRSQNECNKDKYKNNKSGYKGVRLQNNKWRVVIFKDKKKVPYRVFRL